MKSKTAKLISPERVVHLLDCYGANPKAWPEDERATALALIHNSTELQQLQREAEQLDRFLVLGQQVAANEPVNPRLVDNIINNLPAQDKSRRWKWLSQGGASGKSHFASGNWLGMIAASIAVLVISISIVELHSSSVVPHQQNRLTQQELDSWMWDQIGTDSESDDDEPMTMMTFIEL